MCTDKAFNETKLDFGHGFRAFVPDIDDKMYESLYSIRYACGGYGYRLSRDALQFIDKYKPQILSLGLSYEDVLLGQILYLEGIPATKQELGRYHFIAHD